MAVTACGGWHLRGSGEGSAVGMKVFVSRAEAPTVGPALTRNWLIVAQPWSARVAMLMQSLP